jgi:hypothetical protein
MPNVNDDNEETLQFADESEYMQEPKEPDGDFKSGANPGDCFICRPFACDDPDNHLGVPSEYTPLKNRGCRCGADAGGWDCMCFEGPF